MVICDIYKSFCGRTVNSSMTKDTLRCENSSLSHSVEFKSKKTTFSKKQITAYLQCVYLPWTA